MTKLTAIALAAAFAFVSALPLTASEKIFEGTLVCAKCFLHKADAQECQDVLLVSEPDGKKSEYYVTKNEVAKESGEACTVEVKATVTGDVAAKNGRLWITPSKIVKQ